MTFILFYLISFTAIADIPLISQEEAKNQGLLDVYFEESIDQLFLEKHLLSWPFEKFQNDTKMGNNFIQYQPYSPAGYHGGCDMLLQPGSWIYAPVAGNLEAGHYSYKKNSDGSKQKVWKAWPKRGSRTYFELAVVDDQGIRYELHHVDRNSLTREIKSGLDSGSYKVEKGQQLGKVLRWSPSNYTHIHLNVVSPSGEYLNPEYLFKLLEDNREPEVEIYAVLKSGNSVKVKEGHTLKEEVKEFILKTRDFKNGYIIPQAPLKLSLVVNGVGQELDFTLYRRNSTGNFMDFRSLYVMRRQKLGAKFFKNPGSYYHDNSTWFLMRLKAPLNQKDQDFKIIVSDIAENNFQLNGHFFP